MKSSAIRNDGDGTVANGADTFAMRIARALSGRVYAQVAKEIGVAPSTLQRYLQGSMPAADVGLKLAQALSVNPEWLFSGKGQMAVQQEARPFAEIIGLQSQITLLPRYELFGFTERGKPEPEEQIAIPTPWIVAAAKSTNGVWLAEMPNDAMPTLAGEGELLICRDAEEMLQDRRVYIFLFDGKPVVRRAHVRPDGLQLKSEDDSETVLIAPEDLEHLRPVGRVLSAIAIHRV